MPKLYYWAAQDGFRLELPEQVTASDLEYMHEIDVETVLVVLPNKRSFFPPFSYYADENELDKLRKTGVYWTFKTVKITADSWAYHCYYVPESTVIALGSFLPTY